MPSLPGSRAYTARARATFPARYEYQPRLTVCVRLHIYGASYGACVSKAGPRVFAFKFRRPTPPKPRFDRAAALRTHFRAIDLTRDRRDPRGGSSSAAAYPRRRSRPKSKRDVSRGCSIGPRRPIAAVKSRFAERSRIRDLPYRFRVR